jgi:hypothetical protein
MEENINSEQVWASDADIMKKWGYKIKELPFDDMEIYEKEETPVKNKFSGVTFNLNPIELAIYDVLMGAYNIHLLTGKSNPKISLNMWKDFTKGKNWFIKHNPKAYYALID